MFWRFHVRAGDTTTADGRVEPRAQQYPTLYDGVLGAYESDPVWCPACKKQNDKMAVAHDEPTEKQLAAGTSLVKCLTQFFKIKTLGGHREFAMSHGTSRACPGVYGMIIAEQMRRTFKLSVP